MNTSSLVVLALLAGGGYYAYTQGWLQQIPDLLAGLTGGGSLAGLPGGTLAENEALDLIWAWRPDFAAAAGAGGQTAEGRRRFVRAWLASSTDPAVIEAGRSAVRYVQLRGWS